MKRPLFAAVLSLTLLGVLGSSEVTERVRFWRIRRAFDRSMALDRAIRQNSSDTQTLYRLDYQVSDGMLRSMLTDRGKFRALDQHRFELSEWLIPLGVEPHPSASAVLDTHRRTLVCVNTGANIFLIEALLRPFEPKRYAKA